MSRRKDAPESDDDEVTGDRVRLDKWLWAARFFKTRALAADAIDGGKVDVNDDRAKRAKLVGVGDHIRVRNGPVEWHIVVRDTAERRGPASVAQGLYEETDEGRIRREKTQEGLRNMPRILTFGDSRPGKHDRRAIRRMKGDE
jgi:ribosome-associated heat shock protein Hsp15